MLQALVARGALPPLPPGLSADVVAATARVEGVGGLLLKAAEAERSSWAGPLAAALAAERRGALVRTLEQIALAARVLGLLEARGIRALPLKGVVVAETVCDVESDRAMSDVDVLALERWAEAARARDCVPPSGVHVWLRESHRSTMMVPFGEANPRGPAEFDSSVSRA